MVSKLISQDVYLNPILECVPRLLGLLSRNISSSTYGSFDREYWHYNTVDFSNARKQEAVLTLTLLYLIKHKRNKYYRNNEILEYIKAALMFWRKIQNKNGSFSEWYPNENSFVVTAFSSYAVSESLLLIGEQIPDKSRREIIKSLMKAGNWLLRRHETRVMNQQTGAAIALYNIYLLTDDIKYLEASREKISLLGQKQSSEGWFLEYGGPDIGYLSLAIDYLCKYYSKTKDTLVEAIIKRSTGFLKYFIQADLVAGGTYASRNTEYLIPHGFELYSTMNRDAAFVASAVRKSLLKTDSFPGLFDDRYLTYVGYTWLQAYIDANNELNGKVDQNISEHFDRPFRKKFAESGLLVINDERKNLIINMNKGGAFRLYDKHNRRAFTDSGVFVNADNKWHTSGWLSETKKEFNEDFLALSGDLREIPDKTLTPVSNILLRLFQLTLGRWDFISLWIKERLRDMLITKTKLSNVSYNRTMYLNAGQDSLLKIRDSVKAGEKSIATISVFNKDSIIYVPSSRYYVKMKEAPIIENFRDHVKKATITWEIKTEFGIEYSIDK